MPEISVKLIADMSDLEAKMNQINSSVQKAFNPTKIARTYQQAAVTMEKSGKKIGLNISKSLDIAVRSMRSAKWSGLFRSGMEDAQAKKGSGEIGIGDIIGGAIAALTVETVGMIVIAAAVLQILSQLYNGIMWGFSGLMKAVGILGKMIGAILRPFADLFIPIFLLFARLLMPVARLLRLLLLPFYKALIYISKGIADTLVPIMMSVVDAVVGGETALLSGLGLLAGLLWEAVSKLIPTIAPYVIAAFKWMGEAILAFLNLDLGKITDTITRIFGPLAGGVINLFVKTIYWAISAIMGFVGQLMGVDVKSIAKTNEGFQFGGGLATAMQQIYTQLTGFLAALVANPIGTLWGVFVGIIDSVNTKMTEITGIDFVGIAASVSSFILTLTTFWTGISPTLQSMVSNFKADFVDDSGIYKKIINGLTSLYNAITSLIQKIQSFKLPSVGKSVSDALGITKSDDGKAVGGEIDATGLYLMHKGETVTPASSPRGGGSTSINITINGGSMDTKALVRELSKELQKQLGARSTYGTGF